MFREAETEIQKGRKEVLTPRDIEIARETDQEADKLGGNREGACSFCVSEGSVKGEPTKADSSPLPSTELAGGSLGVGVHIAAPAMKLTQPIPQGQASLGGMEPFCLIPKGKGSFLNSPLSRCVWPRAQQPGTSRPDQKTFHL